MTTDRKVTKPDYADGLFQSRYPEASLSSVVFGFVFGSIMNVAMTYSGLKMGFTNPCSAIAAVVGFGVLKGILRRGTILEVAIGQTMTTGMALMSSGVIFTVPVLFLLGYNIGFTDSRYWLLTGAAMAGAVLGVAYIVPLRRQMLEIERLRFPSPTAVATILKTPGAGRAKSLVLACGILAGAIIYAPSGLPALGIRGYASIGAAIEGRSQTANSDPTHPSAEKEPSRVISNDVVDVGVLFGLPRLFPLAFAIAPFAFGVGCLVGRPGLLMLAGGIVTHLLVTPLLYSNHWTPANLPAERVPAFALDAFDRPVGIGVLLGGAFAGILAAAPAMIAGIKNGLTAAKSRKTGFGDEMGRKAVTRTVLAGFICLMVIAIMTEQSAPIGQGLLSGLSPLVARSLVVLVCAAWAWVAGIIIAQCSGMADASPISGIALLTVVFVLMLIGKQEVLFAVTLGTALSSAMICASDMMGDLKVGFLVGAQPRRQQLLQLATCAFAPVLSMAALLLIVGANLKVHGVPIGPGTSTDAPQAQALKAIITAVQHGNVPYALYGLGSMLGLFLGLSLPGSLGVLAGLSMYLKFSYILTYGMGCLTHLVIVEFKGRAWLEAWAMPFAAGLIVGEALLALGINLLVLSHA